MNERAPQSAYTDAGVNVLAGTRAVDMLRARLRTSEHDVLGGIGGFGAVLELPAGYRRPVLVTATDGVGTKTEICRALDRLDTIGLDLVAMCADDVVCHGARPAFFLDYVALGRLDPARVARLVGGIADGCDQIGCDLVGGETAEHPGLMEPDAFDLAGFCIGLVEREDLIDGGGARAGDVVIGLASSGLHSNGYSLVRALMARHDLGLHEPFDDLLERHGVEDGDEVGATLGEELLTPTRLYAPSVLELRDALRQRGLRLSGLAHVTGGGLASNLPRAVLPALGIRLTLGSWPVPRIFDLLARLGGLDGAEMRATFNCGVGMAAVVEPAAVDTAVEFLGDRGIAAWPIGELRPADELGPARYIEVE